MIYLVFIKSGNNKMLFKFSTSDDFGKYYFHTYKPQVAESDIYIASVPINKLIKVTSNISGPSKNVKDDKNIFKYDFNIDKIDVLVDEEGSIISRKAENGMNLSPKDAGINPNKLLNDNTIVGTVSESIIYVDKTKIFRKYSDIINGKIY